MLVDDPNFMSKNAQDNIKAHALYDSAFTNYEQGEYQQAATLLAELDRMYPRNDIPDKAAFLRVMITARTEKPLLLREQLQQFKTQYPASPLVKRADELLASYNDLENKQLLRQEAPQAAPAGSAKNKVDERTPEQKVSTSIAMASARGRNAQPVAVRQTAAAVDSAARDTARTLDLGAVASSNESSVPPVSADTTANAPDTLAAAVDSVDPLAYTNEPDTAYYFVMIYPEEHTAFKDVAVRYEKYNNTYYKNQGLKVEAKPFETGKTMLVNRPFPDLKVAQSYNIKQKAPQSPIGKIRGVEFTTFVISSANYRKFLQKKDLEAYLNYFRTNN